MIVPTLNEQQKNYERNLNMTTENKLQLIRMSEVELQPVDLKTLLDDHWGKEYEDDEQ